MSEKWKRGAHNTDTDCDILLAQCQQDLLEILPEVRKLQSSDPMEYERLMLKLAARHKELQP